MGRCTRCSKETSQQYIYYAAQEIVGQTAKSYQNHRSKGQIVTTEYKGFTEQYAFVCAKCNYRGGMLRSFVVMVVLLIISGIFMSRFGTTGSNFIWLMVTLLITVYYFLHFLYCGFLLLADRYRPEQGAETAIRYKHGSPRNDQGTRIYFTPEEMKRLKSR